MYQNVNPALAGTLIYICLSTTFASAEPNGSSAAEGLVRDMITLVNAAEQRNWQIDRYEIEDLMNDALVCVCRGVSNDTREGGRASTRRNDRKGRRRPKRGLARCEKRRGRNR